ncbi:hypothetical protein [Nocardioides terrisoli]|nr:hypothetical protein [Nocardioides marmorisolisilvae]
MSTLMIALETESGAGATPWIIGACALAILLFSLLCMLAFGKGREHS